MYFEVGVNVFNMLKVKLGSNIGIEGKFGSTKEKTNAKTVSDIVSYRIRHKVIVPPHTSAVEVIAIVDKVILAAPFTAKIQITKMTNADDNAILYYLKRKNTKDVFMDGNSYYINTNGTLGIDGYGFDSIIKTKTILQESGSSSKKPVILYQILLIILQFHFLLIVN